MTKDFRDYISEIIFFKTLNLRFILNVFIKIYRNDWIKKGYEQLDYLREVEEVEGAAPDIGFLKFIAAEIPPTADDNLDLVLTDEP